MIPGLFSILSRVSVLSSITGKEQHKLQADLFIKVPAAGFKMFAWHRADELIELGYRVGMEAIESGFSKSENDSSSESDL